MKLSRSFLDEYVDTKGISNKELADMMTKVGNEYESISEIANATNLVIGEVLECIPHPNSDHLHICKVNVGTDIRQIVCGAPNVKANIKVIVALPGAKLGDIVIKEGVIRQEESKGMLCSLQELGLDSKYLTEEDKKGIHILGDDAVVGSDPLEYLGLDDSYIDFELTSNRNDLLSVLGMAYEVGAILNEKVKLPETTIEKEIEDVKDYISVDVETENCPLYLARIVKNVTINESPNFIKKRLMASGIRPINNVVDISNYVMLEYGQPLHFFDYDALGNKIIIRQAKQDEELTTLDGTSRTLDQSDIVIANENHAVALAGVMGGLKEEIEETTKNIAIESAIFNPVNIRKTSRKILMSEASSRFEKGLDPKRTYAAIDRACYLLEKYANATVIKGIEKYDKISYKENVIKLNKNKISKVLGLEISSDEIVDVFNRLGFKTIVDKENYVVDVPSRRMDIKIEEDLIEEIGRIHGIDNIEGKLPTEEIKPGKRTYSYEIEKIVKENLISSGLKEVITYSLVDEKMLNQFKEEDFESYKVLRPISKDKEYMRNSIVPSLINVYNYNVSRKNESVNIFEVSETYVKIDNKMKESKKVAILMSGDLSETKWLGIKQTANFYLLKGIVINLLNYLGFKGRIVIDSTCDINELHPYNKASIYVDREKVGYIGKVHPEISKKDLYVCEINLTKVMTLHIKPIKNKEISKYPTIKKDVAFVVDNNIKSLDITNTIKKVGTQLLKDIDIFDLYTGNNIIGSKKSIAYTLTFNSSDRTLTEEEVDKIFRNIIEKVETTYNAKIRDK